MLGVVEAVPELASDPKVFAGNTGLLDTSSDGIFVPVSPSAVKVTVTGLECVSDSGRSLLLGHFPSTETQLGISAPLAKVKLADLRTAEAYMIAICHEAAEGCVYVRW